jgi:DNA-binding NarL/FixJ family response regulator
VKAEAVALHVRIVGIPPAFAETLSARLVDADSRLVPRVVAATDAVAAVEQSTPNVVVVALDGSAPDAETQHLERLLRASDNVPVVLVSSVDDEDVAVEAIRRGARGYLLSGTSGPELTVALRRACRGETVVDLGLGGRMATSAGRRPVPSPTDSWHLRPRERAVLDRLVAGRSNREIAADLHLGEETVKTHLRSVYRKLGVRDRSQAVGEVLRQKR